MALTQEEMAAQARAVRLNGGRYDAQTNPGGLAGEGYKTNWPKGLNDTATLVGAVVREVMDMAGSIASAEEARNGAEAARAATYTIKADAEASMTALLGDAEAFAAVAGEAKEGAEAARDAAQAAVASVSLPILTASDAGRILVVNSTGTGFEIGDLPADNSEDDTAGLSKNWLFGG